MSSIPPSENLPAPSKTTIVETSEPLLYHLYHHQRLRQEAIAENKASKKAKKPEPPKPWQMSRDKDFVGPTYQEEFIRRRLLELEEQLEKLSRDKDFAGVWDREVVEPLQEWVGMNNEKKMHDDEAAGVMREGSGRIEYMVGQELQVVEHEGTGGTIYDEKSSENEDAEGEDLIMEDDTEDGGSAAQGPGSVASGKARFNCLKCRKDKKGCDKALPVCGRCSEKGHECVYPEK